MMAISCAPSGSSSWSTTTSAGTLHPAARAAPTVTHTGHKDADADPATPHPPPKPAPEAGIAMLITILIILAIVALALWILGALR
jgi:hypothetical protein